MPYDKRYDSPTVLSDLFRYELLAKVDGFWTDVDVYCIRPFPRRDYLFGFERVGRLNINVLGLPQQSAVLDDLRAIAQLSAPPPWVGLGPRSWAKFVMGRMKGLPVASLLHFGATGPAALTYLAERRNLMSHALPCDVFSPVAYDQRMLFGDPGLELVDLTTPRTLGVHFYNYAMSSIDYDQLPPSSPLGRILRK